MPVAAAIGANSYLKLDQGDLGVHVLSVGMKKNVDVRDMAKRRRPSDGHALP
jgi:hypothetical protein